MKCFLYRLTSLIFFVLLLNSVSAQSVAITDDGSAAHASAMLEVKVTAAAKKGILVPRMTTAERVAIAAPAKGLLVFDNTTSSFWYYNGAAWITLSSGVATNYWTASGSNIYNNNSGNVGIGISTPKAKFNVAENRTVLFGKDTTTGGRKFIWYPTKGALRFGTVDTLFSTTSWNYANVGVNSLAFGGSTVASGPQSIASGVATTASGFYSWAHGFATISSGEHSMAVGQNTGAIGAHSFALGNTTRTYADHSQAFGYQNHTSGTFSTVVGHSNIARAFSSLVIGRNSDTTTSTSPGTWVTTDPVFLIGTGASSNSRFNSFVVLKNGVTGIGGNPTGNATSWGALQVKTFSAKDNLTLVNSNAVNRWGFYVTTDLNLYFNGGFKGSFNDVDGAYIAVSDRRLKKDIQPESEVLQKVLKLVPYKYRYADNNSSDALSHGFMAQDIQAVLPDYVATITDRDGKEYLGVNYNKITVLAIKAVQEQQQIIDRQEKKINDLEKRLLALESKMK